jgi:hypothetical protein
MPTGCLRLDGEEEMLPPRDENQQIANLLYDLAEIHRRSPRYWGYTQAARKIRRIPWLLSDLTERETLSIPSIGRATYRVVREVLSTGSSSSVERAISESGKEREVNERRAFRQNSLSQGLSRVATVGRLCSAGSMVKSSTGVRSVACSVAAGTTPCDVVRFFHIDWPKACCRMPSSPVRARSQER